MKFAAITLSVTLLAGGARAEPPQPPSGEYVMDLGHTSVNFRVRHLGLSNFTLRFTRIEGRLQFDPANPAGQSVAAAIDPASIQTNYPDPKVDFDGTIRGAEFLDAARFPKITFRSTKVSLTSPNTARVTGDLTLHGVTRPVTLDVVYNGGFPPTDYDPAGSRIGFSARGTLRRSDFGMGYGVPAPGSTVGVSDEVEIVIETEFTRKPGAKP